MGEKDETTIEAQEEPQKWPLPYNIGIDTFDKIVKAFYQAGADTKKVSPNDLRGSTGLNINTIKGNIKFLLAIGILKPSDEKDKYLFDAKGETYAKALATNDKTTLPTVLKELMTASYLKELINYVELQKPSDLTFEQLSQHIKGMARLTEDTEKYGPLGISPPYRSGVATIIDLLARARIIPPDIVAKKEPIRTPTAARKATRKSELPASTDIGTAPTIASIQGTVNNFPFTLNIMVEAKDPESIKQLISLIRELRGQTEQDSS